jgi:hypothetical protein
MSAIVKSKFMSHPAATLLAVFHQLWPVGMGATLGQVVAQTEQWRYPWVAAIVTGALVQIAIALLRSWFNERRDLLQTMKAMLGEQRATYLTFIDSEKDERHRMANRAASAELKLHMVRAGVPVNRLPDPAPLYPEGKENDVDSSES